MVVTGKRRTDPGMEFEESKVILAYEATVGHIGEEQLFYLMSRGIKGGVI